MSLINQMLQDLEKRQPGVLNSAPPPTLVAVPMRRRIHPAWWSVPLLAILVGVFVWLLAFRSPARQVVVVTPAPAPAAQIRPAQTRSLQPLAVSPTASLPLTNQVAQVPVVSPPTEKMAAATAPPAAALPEKIPLPAQVEKPDIQAAGLHDAEVAPADLTPSRASVDKLKKPPQTNVDKPLRASIHAVEKEAFSAGAVTKQLREFTPQQQAENEYRKAIGMLQQGRVKEAAEELTHALQLDPRHAGARQTLVGLLLEANRYGDAERKLEEGLAIAPDQPDLIMILARLQVERGDTRGGLATLVRGLPYASENADYQAFLAALLQREGRHRQAIEHYLLALRNAPQTGIWLMGLGISLQAENRLPEAREAFSRARTSNTLSPELQAFVAQRLKQLGS